MRKGNANWWVFFLSADDAWNAEEERIHGVSDLSSPFSVFFLYLVSFLASWKTMLLIISSEHSHGILGDAKRSTIFRIQICFNFYFCFQEEGTARIWKTQGTHSNRERGEFIIAAKCFLYSMFWFTPWKQISTRYYASLFKHWGPDEMHFAFRTMYIDQHIYHSLIHF